MITGSLSQDSLVRGLGYKGAATLAGTEQVVRDFLSLSDPPLRDDVAYTADAAGTMARLDAAPKSSRANDVATARPGQIYKRAVDILIAVAVIFLLAPLMLLLIVGIKTSTRGPAIYRHRRIGRNGREFDCLKFRTMVPNADGILDTLLASDPRAAEEWERTRKLSRDPRITLLGHVLRRSSLDELPQVINVLRGEMSCVGPRPVTRGELVRYGARTELFTTVLPGMTGLWQVSGRSSIDYEKRVALDCEYVANWSLWLDMKILAKTIPAMLNTRQTS